VKIIGISGSPTSNGSVDRLVQLILNNLGKEGNVFISLKDYQINPCKGCLGCVKTNRCVQKDEWSLVEEKIKNADILVLGVPTYYGAAFGVNALTHNFLERWFAFRHNGLKLKLKKVVLAAVSGEGHGDMAITSLKTFFEAYHGIEVVNSITAHGTTPCYVCGSGEDCPLSCVIMRHGKGAKITADMIMPLEAQKDVISKVREMKERILI
jgi:multimeric flavodoxin WrbA